MNQLAKVKNQKHFSHQLFSNSFTSIITIKASTVASKQKLQIPMFKITHKRIFHINQYLQVNNYSYLIIIYILKTLVDNGKKQPKKNYMK